VLRPLLSEFVPPPSSFHRRILLLLPRNRCRLQLNSVPCVSG
jgi:hypothetical protein